MWAAALTGICTGSWDVDSGLLACMANAFSVKLFH